ncbi:MAG: hypothetical protein WCV67_10190 [Victivallaceae bacterium]
MTEIDKIIADTLKYIVAAQDFSPGEYYGAFWSEKAYHAPLLDWHGGGSHHHRGAGSAALAMWLTAVESSDSEMKYHAEQAFDWLVSRQHNRGGWFEIQNNEKPSDWENTGFEELSTIETAFAIHGLGYALLNGLPPKKSYMDCLQKAGHWLLTLEWPAGSGIFPHHERSPHDTLNANAHSVESLTLIFCCLEKIYGRSMNIFLQGARRGFVHTLPLQWENGCYPYRNDNGSTINYTSLVLWCFLNTLEILPERFRFGWPDQRIIKKHLDKAASFLCSSINQDGTLDWEKSETSTAKYNIWAYAITANVLTRIGGKENCESAKKILECLINMKTNSGLLPMRDRGDEIIECLFMQADILLFMPPLSKCMKEAATGTCRENEHLRNVIKSTKIRGKNLMAV